MVNKKITTLAREYYESEESAITYIRADMDDLRCQNQAFEDNVLCILHRQLEVNLIDDWEILEP